MVTHKETFDTQIQKFKDLKEERDKKIKELDRSWLMYKPLIWAKKQIFEAFSERATELRSNPDYKQAQKLRSAYLEAKRAYEAEEQSEGEVEKQSDYLIICENLKSYAESMQEEGNNLIHKMLVAWVSTAKINETFYRKWQDILTHFKDFCSWWSNNIYEEKERNNSVIIEQLWLKETFENIFRRCVLFADKYRDSRSQGIQYFDFMVDTFKNIKDTIKYFKEEWSANEWKYKDRLFHSISK